MKKSKSALGPSAEEVLGGELEAKLKELLQLVSIHPICGSNHEAVEIS